MADLYVAKLDGEEIAIKTNTTGVDGLTEFVEEKIKNGGTVTAPVQSVNGKTGEVVLTADDVSALPASTIIPTIPDIATAASDGLMSKEDKAKLDVIPEITFEKVGEV